MLSTSALECSLPSENNSFDNAYTSTTRLVCHNKTLRLEAATSRLEDIAEAQAQGKSVSSTAATHSQHPSAASAPPPPPPPAEDPASVQAYDNDVIPALDSYVKLSGEIGSVVAEQVTILLDLNA